MGRFIVVAFDEVVELAMLLPAGPANPIELVELRPYSLRYVQS